MNRFVLSYTSKTDHLKKGQFSVTEYCVFDVMFHAAGWSEQRPDFARIPRNVSKLHREHFLDEETGYEVMTRQNLDKVIRSLIKKGYVLEDGSWWHIPTYQKWQVEIPKLLREQKALAKGTQKSALPGAKPLANQTQEIAPPVAGVRPQLQGSALPVAESAPPVATTALPVAIEGGETGTTSASPDPSIMFNQSTISPTIPPTPQGEEGGAEEEMLRNQLEAFFSRELQTADLGPADYRHIRTIIDRKIPIELVKQVVADVKRAYKPKYAGDRIRGIGIFMRELEARFAAPSTPVPTGGEAVAVASAPAHTAESITKDERLSNKLHELRTVVVNACKLRKGDADPKFEAAVRGVRREAADAGIPWELIVAGTGLTKPRGGVA